MFDAPTNIFCNIVYILVDKSVNIELLRSNTRHVIALAIVLESQYIIDYVINLLMDTENVSENFGEILK